MNKGTVKNFGYAMFAALFAIVTALMLCFSSFGSLRAEAVTQTVVAISDDFDSIPDSGYWAKNDFKVKHENYSLTFYGGSHDFIATTMLADYEIQESCAIDFKVTVEDVPSDGQNDNWFGISFGHKSVYTDTGYASAMLVCQDYDIQLMDRYGVSGYQDYLADPSIPRNPSYKNQSFIKNGREGRVNVSFVLTKTEQKEEGGAEKPLYKLDYYVWGENEEKPTVPIQTTAGAQGATDMFIPADGYMGFTIMNNMKIRLYDFKITASDDDEVLFEDDFEGDPLYGVGSEMSGATWHRNGHSSLQTYISADGYVDTFEKNEGVMISAEPLTLDPYCEKQFELSFTAQADTLADGASYGVGFGLSTASTRADQRNFVGIQGLADGNAQIALIVNGKTRLASEPFAYGAGKHIMNIIGYYDGHIEFAFDGKTAKFYDLHLWGHLALGKVGNVQNDLIFDNITLQSTSTVKGKNLQNDLAIDFSGVREEIDEDEVFVTKYLDTSKWYKGVGVSLPRYSLSEQRNYIEFREANENSAFGPRYRFADFVCRFGVMVSQNAAQASQNSKIGISFGKSEPRARYDEATGVYFARKGNNMELQIYGANCEQADSTGTVPCDGSLWSSDNVADNPVTYRVMLVVRGGVAKVYFAPVGAPASEMQIERATLTDFNGYGFVTVTGLGGTYFRLEDFSITNTAVRR